jgi:hypothetical protein
MPTPSWTSSGATQAGANTDWTLASTYNGYDYFTGASGWFLWSASAITPFYVISETLGSSSPGHYESATPPAALPDNPWTGAGSFTFDTAPTVTAYSGGGGDTSTAVFNVTCPLGGTVGTLAGVPVKCYDGATLVDTQSTAMDNAAMFTDLLVYRDGDVGDPISYRFEPQSADGGVGRTFSPTDCTQAFNPGATPAINVYLIDGIPLLAIFPATYAPTGGTRTVTGRLTHSGGAGVSHFAVNARPFGEPPSTGAMTDADGYYSIGSLTEADNWIIFPNSDNGLTFSPTEQTVDLTSSNATDIDFVVTAAPEVTITTPTDGSVVSGVVTVSWEAGANVETRLLVNSTPTLLATYCGPGPYSLLWNTDVMEAGSHVLRAEADDGAGSTGFAEVTVTVGRAAVLPNLFHHVAEDYRHDLISSGSGVSGGYRGRIDQNSRGVVADDWFNVFEAEPVLPFINSFMDEDPHVFLDRPWTMVEFLGLMSHVRNGVGVGLSGDQHTNWYAGGDGAAFDLSPLFSASGDLLIANRCRSWTPAPGVRYKPRAVIMLGGGMEVLAVVSGVPDRNDATAAPVYRAHLDESSPTSVETLSSDASGMVEAGFYPEAELYTQTTVGSGAYEQTYWDATNWAYKLKDWWVGRLYRRQVIINNLLVLINGGRVCHFHCADGTIHIYYTSSTGMRCRVIPAYVTPTPTILSDTAVTNNPGDTFPYAWQVGSPCDYLLFQRGVDLYWMRAYAPSIPEKWSTPAMALTAAQILAQCDMPPQGKVLVLYLSGTTVQSALVRYAADGTLDWASAVTAEATGFTLTPEQGGTLVFTYQGGFTFSFYAAGAVHVYASYTGTDWVEI